MALPIDVTTSFLRPSQLEALVRAVLAANSEDEHRWIEWKSTVDLGTATGLAHVVKHTLGLANRDPAAASQRAGGYGYVLFGVEPGNLCGTLPVDPEILVGQVRAFLGDAVKWTPEYINVDGKTVLVVVVDPPQPGDPIHNLKKQLGSLQPGTPLVRHTGRTDPATPADMDMLQARLLQRSARLAIEVIPIGRTLETFLQLDEIETWTGSRRPGLLRARYGRSVEEPNTLSLSVMNSLNRDPRSPQEYEAEIDAYLDAVKGTFVARTLWRLQQHVPAQLRVRVENPTDQGFRAIRLQLHLSGDVTGYEAVSDLLRDGDDDFPDPPKPLGTPRSNLIDTRFITMNAPFIPTPRIDVSPGYHVSDGGSVDVEFDDFDLRPHDKLSLPAVALLVREPAGAILSGTWRATGDGVRGQLTGTFEINVVGSTLDCGGLPAI